MPAQPTLPLHGLTVRPCEYLAGTTFAYRDLHELQVSPELFARLKAVGPGEVAKCFEGVSVMDLRKYRECKG